MRQTLHIFRKDVRHLWPEIFPVLAAAAGFTLSVAGAAASSTSSGSASSLFTPLLPVVWFALIAHAIYDEPLAGGQPFWLTRPYSRISLLASKALFIAVFVNLPKLIGDAYILHAYGFGIVSELGGLLWTQVLLTALFVLPVAALCAVTTGLVQLIMAVIVLVLAIGGLIFVLPGSTGSPWFALEWIRFYGAVLVLAVSAAVIVVRQYARRGTVCSRFMAGGAVVAVFLVMLLLPWPAAFALQSRFSTQPIDLSQIHIGSDPATKWRARALVYRDNTVDLQIPLSITGIPDGLALITEGIVATIDGPGGNVWHSHWSPQTQGLFRTVLDSSFYGKVKNQSVRIRGSVYMTLYGNPRSATLPIRERPVFQPTPGGGLCSATSAPMGILLNCRSAFGSRPDIVTFNIMGSALSSRLPVSYSPFPADADLIPVKSVEIAQARGPVLHVRATAIVPVAHISKEFEVTGLRLAEFETVIR